MSSYIAIILLFIDVMISFKDLKAIGRYSTYKQARKVINQAIIIRRKQLISLKNNKLMNEPTKRQQTNEQQPNGQPIN